MIAAGTGFLGKGILAGQRAVLHLVMSEMLTRPGNPLGQQKTSQATVFRLYVQAFVRAETHQALLVIGPHFEDVLFLAYPLSGQLQRQAQQAVLFAQAFNPAQLDKAQRPCAGMAIGRQGGQAQQAKVFGWQLGPWMGLFDHFLGGGVGIGVRLWAVSHKRKSWARRQWKRRLVTALIGRRPANWRLALCRCAG